MRTQSLRIDPEVIFSVPAFLPWHSRARTLHLPKSAHDALIFGLSQNPRVQLAKQTVIQRRLLKKVTEPSHKYTLSTPEAEPDQEIRTDRAGNAVLRRSKQKSMRSSFQLLQTAGKNLEAMQRLVVCEAVTDCKGKKTNAAKMLGIKLGKLKKLAHPSV